MHPRALASGFLRLTALSSRTNQRSLRSCRASEHEVRREPLTLSSHVPRAPAARGPEPSCPKGHGRPSGSHCVFPLSQEPGQSREGAGQATSLMGPSLLRSDLDLLHDIPSPPLPLPEERGPLGFPLQPRLCAPASHLATCPELSPARGSLLALKNPSREASNTASAWMGPSLRCLPALDSHFLIAPCAAKPTRVCLCDIVRCGFFWWRFCSPSIPRSPGPRSLMVEFSVNSE